jgi:hypothetical protein
MPTHRRWAICLAMLLLSYGPAIAQSTYGGLAGTVRDQNGGVIAGASIVLVNEGTGKEEQTTSNSEGVFLIPQLPPGSYRMKITMNGFKETSYTAIQVYPGQERSVAAVLEIGNVGEAIQVRAGADLVHTTSPELNNTVVQAQSISLPLDGRNPIELVRLQAGVAGIVTRTNTAINGGRPWWTKVTQDGISIQDNLVRTNSVDVIVNRPTSDSIGDFTITTNTQGADAAGGSSQIKMISPSGTSRFHGSIYEYNRNSALGANSWFNNRSGVDIPFLNRNQFGGRLAGPVLLPGPLRRINPNRSKLFFFFNYEGLRQAQQAQQNNAIPVRNDFLDGVYRYVRPSDNTVQSVNVLQLAGIPLDPKIRTEILSRVPSASQVNNFDVGDSSPSRALNTAGLRFNQSQRTSKNYFAIRGDYEPTANDHIEFVFTNTRNINDRTDLDLVHLRPVVYTDALIRLFVGAWRRTIGANIVNEVRIGGHYYPNLFISDEQYSGTVWSIPFLTNPEVSFQPQGRTTRTRHFIDNVSWTAGSHALQFGGSLQQVRTDPYDFVNRFPTVAFGFSSAAPTNIQLTAARFPGGSISAADLTSANSLTSFLGGIVRQVSQTFQVKDRTSGYVAGIPSQRNYSTNDLALYLQDRWRLRPNLTLTMGLKWEYFSPLREDDDLAFFPVIRGESAEGTLLDPNSVVTFVNGDYWKKDFNNFGPVVGVAWDPFKDGKTSLRAGYTLAYIDDNTIGYGRAADRNNAGLTTSVTLANVYAVANAGIPAPAAPEFREQRTFVDQLSLSPLGFAYSIDPDLRQPHVHQISVSIERELPFDFAVEGRYVSTMGRSVWRSLDPNQVRIGGEFFQDFLRARSNGFLALSRAPNSPGCTTATCGVFNPAFNTSIPGSQQLTVIPNFSTGSLTNSTVRSNIQTGQVGTLAEFYLNNRASGAHAAFLPNPNIGQTGLLTDDVFTDYHSFQGEIRRRFRGGIFGQLNYTFSKVLSNSSGTGDAGFEPPLDNARPGLEKRRADYDRTHILNANFVSELPFGPGKRFLNERSFLSYLLGGWVVSSIIHWQSGAPFSILSGRGTFNRGGRSAGNPADSSLTRDQLAALFKVRKLPDGRVFYIDPSVTDPNTGLAVGPDNLNYTAGFAGQVFFNPVAGTLGSLQRLQFDGPAQFAWDVSVMKRTVIREALNVEFRAEFFNFLNHPSFSVGDTNINSSQFGRITSTSQNSRVVQLALRLSF